ncbi:MAG: MBL fold metallo-hydrolase [Dehalococcoidia bacterium]|nr:MBL fold metallo-hydrolase [Dehalococcoidia bacterium]
MDKRPCKQVSFASLTMEITRSGHSTIALRGKEVTLVIDPCPPSYGCVAKWSTPNAVLVSHDHPGHSFTDNITDTCRIFRGPGEYEIGGAFITGLSSYHDDENGAVRGKNTVFVIEMEGLTICHVGDLGHPLSGSLARGVGKVDILCLPVGDVTTLSVSSARALALSVEARYILPMHYRTDAARSELEPVDTFLTTMGVPQAESKPKLMVTATSLPMSPQVVVLTCESRAA